MAFAASASLSAVAIACLISLLWKGPNLQVLFLGGPEDAYGGAVGRRDWPRLHRTCGLPHRLRAAYVRALILCAANWIFADDQIHFVQLRIHSARVTAFSQKFERGKFFLLAQPALFASPVGATLLRLLPPLAIIAFVPALVRGGLWFFRKPEPPDVRGLGWSEMRHGVAFGVLLAFAFIYS
jgi:hypothetical protein